MELQKLHHRFTLNIRPSDLYLDRVLNPAQHEEIGRATPAQLIDACGIIPDFFCHACQIADPLTLDNIAARMDEVYKFGGFCYPFGGTVDPETGVYQSDHDEDPDLPPLARFTFEGFACYVYENAITAIVDLSTLERKIARFD